MIKDTRGGTISNENDFIEQDESMNNCLGAFSISNVIKVFKTCFKKRSGYIRGIILLLILTMLFNMGTDSSNLIYLFTRLKLDWDEQYYAVFAAVASGATSLFTFAFITISSYGLNVHDTVIGITGALFGLLGRLTYAFASKTWMMYLGKKNNMIFKFSCLETIDYYYTGLDKFFFLNVNCLFRSCNRVIKFNSFNNNKICIIKSYSLK